MAERNKLSSKQQNFHEGGNFDHNSPRPPIPGEEKSHCMSDWVSQSSTMDWMRKYKSSSPIPRKSHNNGKAETMVYALEKILVYCWLQILDAIRTGKMSLTNAIIAIPPTIHHRHD